MDHISLSIYEMIVNSFPSYNSIITNEERGTLVAILGKETITKEKYLELDFLMVLH